VSAPIDALTDAPTEAEEFVAAARQSLRGGDGAAALDALGWWGLLDHLDDRSLRTAAFALFRAQGRELASSPALGALLAQPYAASTGAAPGTVVAAALRHSPRKGLVAVVVGDVAGRAVLVDRPGEGVSLVDGDDLRRVDVPSTPSRSRTRPWCRWWSCSAVKPMPPSTCSARSQALRPLRPASALTTSS